MNCGIIDNCRKVLSISLAILFIALINGQEKIDQNKLESARQIFESTNNIAVNNFSESKLGVSFSKRAEFKQPEAWVNQLKAAKESGDGRTVSRIEGERNKTPFEKSSRVSSTVGRPGSPIDKPESFNPPIEWGNDILVRGSTNYDWTESYPSMAAASNSTIYLAWQNDSPFFGFQNFIQIFSSTDGGISWQSFGFLGNTNYEITQPSIAVGEGNGQDKLVIAYIVDDPAGSYVEVATTLLSTYSATIIVPNLPAIYERVSKPCVWTDNYAFASWYIYLTVEAVENASLDNYNTLFWRSWDYGATMSNSTALFGGYDSDKWVDPDGSFGTSQRQLFVAAFNVTDKKIYYKKSTDYGGSWSDSVFINTVSLQTSHPVDPDIEAAAENNNVMICFTNNLYSGVGQDDICYSYSTDAGAAWTPVYGLILLQNSDEFGVQLVANELGGFWHVAYMSTDKKIRYNKRPQNLSRDWQSANEEVNNGTTISESFSRIGIVSEWVYDLAGIAWSDSRLSASPTDRDIYFDFDYGDPVIDFSPAQTYIYQSNPNTDSSYMNIRNLGNVPLVIEDFPALGYEFISIGNDVSFPITIQPSASKNVKVLVDWQHPDFNSTAYVFYTCNDPYSPYGSHEVRLIKNGPVGPVYYVINDANFGNTSGNDDGVLNSGETVEFYVLFKNYGPDVNGMQACLTENSPYVSVVGNNCVNLSNMPSGSLVGNTVPFVLSINPATPNNHAFSCEIQITAANGGPWSSYYYLLVENSPPAITVTNNPLTFNVPLVPGPTYLDDFTIYNSVPAGSKNLNYHIYVVDTLITTEEVKALIIDESKAQKPKVRGMITGIGDEFTDLTAVTDATGYNLKNPEQTVVSNKIELTKYSETRQSYTLFDSGPFINSYGTGFQGLNESQLQTSLGMSTLGRSTVNASARLADDFTVVSPDGWSIETLEFYAYKTLNSIIANSINVNYRIWDGFPEDPGSNIVFGDTITNRFLKSEFANSVRLAEYNSGNFNGPIFKYTISGGFHLPPGTYWFDFNYSSDEASVYCIPVTINGQTTTGNSYYKYSGVWNPFYDVGHQGLPFKINGYSQNECAWLTTNPTNGSLPASLTEAISLFGNELSNLNAGTYNCTIIIISDDPSTQITTLPVTINTFHPNPTNFAALSNYSGYVPLAWSGPEGYALKKNISKNVSTLVDEKTEEPDLIENKSGNILGIEATQLLYYDIYRSASQGGPYSLVRSNVLREYFIDSTAVNGQNYFYTVKAVFNNGESGYSNESSAAAVNGGNVINSNPLSQTPIVDGFIDPLEWGDAAIVDLTLPNYDSTITAYIKNDEYYLYIAVDDRGVSSFNTTDISLIIAFDENMDREYPQNPPSGEGTFANLSDGVGSLPIYFNAISGTWQNNTLIEPALIDNGVEFYAGLQSAHAQYEIKIDLTASNLNAIQGDSIGILIYYEADRSTIEWSGAFPKDAIDVPIYYSTPQLPASFGTLVLANNSQLNFYSEFLVEDNCGTSEPLFFGTAADATDGYDNLYDQYAQAIPPVGFDARFIVEELNLIADFRSTAIDTPVVWNVHYQSDAFCTPFTFSWMPNQLSQTGDFRLVDGATNGLQVNIDMRTTSSYIDNEGLGHLRIIQFPRSYVGSEMNAGWNLVGLAFESDDSHYNTIYPNAVISSLFGFNNGYFAADTLRKGVGYWIKNNVDEIVYLNGAEFNTNSIQMQSGWNLISGLSCNFPIASVSDPGNIIVPGTLFGYNNAYYNSDTLKQGEGFWIKTNSAGTVNLDCNSKMSKSTTGKLMADALADFNLIELTDLKNQKQKLYFDGKFDENISPESFSLPPIPPAGISDIRLAGGFRAVESEAVLIELQSVEFPLSVKIFGKQETSTSKFNIQGLSNGKIIFEKELQTDVEFQIAESINQLSISYLEAVPTSYALLQNYPNPFNPSTTIGYSIPEKVKVNLTVYDILGRVVKVLVDETKEAGVYSVNVNFKNFASGVYIYQLIAGEYSKTFKMSLLK